MNQGKLHYGWIVIFMGMLTTIAAHGFGPTRGIDIGAKVEVHRLISELAASGLAIILISSDLSEVLAMSDRIVVLHEGRVTAEIPRSQATQERVMFAATGNLAADEGDFPAASAGEALRG